MLKACEDYGPRGKVRMMVLENQRHAVEICDKLKKNPDDFEDLARDYSVEPNSRALGGAVPPIRKNSGAHEEIRKAAFRMKTAGEISGVIQVDVNQYVIMKYEGMTEPVEHDPKDVEAQLHEELLEREVQVMVASTFENLKKNARVDNYLTGESRLPDEQSAKGSVKGVGFERVIRQ
ncbi:MAG: peptidylprolyl isomerase [Planctomycetaceae bacterium]